MTTTADIKIEPLLTRHEVCELLKCSQTTLRKLAQLGKIRPLRAGRMVRYPPAEIRRFLQENTD